MSRAIMSRVFVSEELSLQDSEDEADLHDWLLAATRHSQATGEFSAGVDPEVFVGVLVATLSAVAGKWVRSEMQEPLWPVLEPYISHVISGASEEGK